MGIITEPTRGCAPGLYFGFRREDKQLDAGYKVDAFKAELGAYQVDESLRAILTAAGYSLATTVWIVDVAQRFTRDPSYTPVDDAEYSLFSPFGDGVTIRFSPRAADWGYQLFLHPADGYYVADQMGEIARKLKAGYAESTYNESLSPSTVQVNSESVPVEPDVQADAPQVSQSVAIMVDTIVSPVEAPTAVLPTAVQVDAPTTVTETPSLYPAATVVVDSNVDVPSSAVVDLPSLITQLPPARYSNLSLVFENAAESAETIVETSQLVAERQALAARYEAYKAEHQRIVDFHDERLRRLDNQVQSYNETIRWAQDRVLTQLQELDLTTLDTVAAMCAKTAELKRSAQPA